MIPKKQKLPQFLDHSKKAVAFLRSHLQPLLDLSL